MEVLMTEGIIDVGFAALEASETHYSSEDLALKLVDRALTSRNSDLIGLPVRFAILIATGEWARPSQQLPRYVRDALHNRVGYEIPLLGGSMSALFSYRQGDGGLIEHGALLILFCSKHLWGTVDSTDKPYNDCEPNRDELESLAERLKIDGQPRLGTSADRYLIGIFPGFRRDSRNNRCYHDNELCSAVLESFGFEYHVFGAAASDKLEPETGFQFANDKVMESGLALALMESDLCTGTRMKACFVPTDRGIRIDRFIDNTEKGYDVELIDSKPAAERIQELICANVSGVKGRIILGLRTGNEYSIVMPIDSGL
jgi:hypothetical protein